jgi:shikimate kinase
MNKAIVLIGPMGVGKTTIGKKLAKRLGKLFLDTDEIITKQHGLISEIFANQGEVAFRHIETKVLIDALQQEAVVATGGGAVLSEENQKALTKHLVIYLSTNGRHIGSRLVGGNRPLLSNGYEDWLKIYETRKPLYEKLANISIDTSGKPLKGILDEIEQRLEIDEQ